MLEVAQRRNEEFKESRAPTNSLLFHFDFELVHSRFGPRFDLLVLVLCVPALPPPLAQQSLVPDLSRKQDVRCWCGGNAIDDDASSRNRGYLPP
jgi:hypothetical protein